MEEASGSPAEVPDTCHETVMTYLAMQTQWRVGFAGRTGLDYAALEPVMRMSGVPRKRWPSVFDEVQTMEFAALRYWDEKKRG